MTSPAVGLSDPTDVVGRRYVAAAIDVGIGAALSLPLFLVLSETVHSFDPVSGRLSQSRELSGVEGAVFLAWLLAYAVGVFVLQRGITGRTVGTMLTGLVVVDGDGRPLGPARALLRSTAGVVDYVPCGCVPLVGLVTTLTLPGHQRVGDLAARSFVVDRSCAGRPLTRPAQVTSAPDHGPAAPAPPPGPAPAHPDLRFPTAPPTTAPPVWDPARGAYMAWHPGRQQWLQFDEPSQRWLEYDAITDRWRPLG